MPAFILVNVTHMQAVISKGTEKHLSKRRFNKMSYHEHAHWLLKYLIDQ